MNLGMNAYKAIKVSKSQLSYEMEVGIDAAKGLDVGGKQHG
jgi:hypothetical protein